MKLPVDVGTASREELIEVIGQLLRYIEVLRNENSALQARIAALEGQRKRPIDGPAHGLKETKKPPSWVKANRPPRGNKERQKRVHGFARRREEPTHRMEHAAASCPGCAIPLAGGKVLERRHVISIPRVRARVTGHLVLERTCRKCKKRWTSAPDWKSIAVGRQRIGIPVQSEVSVLREECRLPLWVIQRYLKWRYGLGLSLGKLVGLVRGAAERGRKEYTRLEEYNRLREVVRASLEVYGDETGWREDGRNGCLWSFSTRIVRYFVHRLSRANTVVKEVLGTSLKGCWSATSDFRLLWSLKRVSGAPSAVLDPPVAGHSRAEGAFSSTPGAGPMVPAGAGSI